MNFKEPLSEEEQNLLLEKVKDDPEAKDKLILHNLRLVNWVARKFYRPGTNELDDLFQLGVIGLIEAIDKYDPTREAKFSTYAIWPIKNSITRNMFIFTRDISIDDPVPGFEDITIKDTLKDDNLRPDDEALGKVFLDQIKNEFRPRLTDLQYNSLILYLGLGCREHSLKEIGDIFNESPEKIRTSRDQALRIIGRSKFIEGIKREVDLETIFIKGVNYNNTKIQGGLIYRSPVEALVLARERIRKQIEDNLDTGEVEIL